MKLETVANLTIALLFGVIAGILGLVLYLGGFPGAFGIAISLIFSLIILALQWYLSPFIIVFMTGARELEKNEYPIVHTSVEGLAKRSGIPAPKLWIVNDGTPNAFAFGRGQRDANIAVHIGLVHMLNDREVESVLAHEMGHIKHRDMVIMTIASVIPILLYYSAITALSWGRRRDERGPSPIAVMLGGLLARFVGQLLVMWLSRLREFDADEFSARMTKPQHLMSALAKISYTQRKTNDALGSLYIAENTGEDANRLARYVKMPVSELQDALAREEKSGFMEIFMTHPRTSRRLLALSKLAYYRNILDSQAS